MSTSLSTDQAQQLQFETDQELSIFAALEALTHISEQVFILDPDKDPDTTDFTFRFFRDISELVQDTLYKQLKNVEDIFTGIAGHRASGACYALATLANEFEYHYASQGPDECPTQEIVAHALCIAGMALRDTIQHSEPGVLRNSQQARLVQNLDSALDHPFNWLATRWTKPTRL